MRTTFRNADFDQLAAVWNANCIPKYEITPDILRVCTVENEMFDWGASTIEQGLNGPIGFSVVKKNASGHYGAKNLDTAHLSAIVFSDFQDGVDMLAHSKRVLREKGVSKLLFGQDSGHFFPGCPTDCHRLRDFLRIEGFEESGEQVDLTADLASYTPPPGEPNVFAEAAPLAPKDTVGLDEFMSREFPGRWRYDLFRKFHAEGEVCFVMGLFVSSRIQGFALLQHEGHKLPIAGAVWQRSLGTNWCTLGPIGVASELRGHGLGDFLLSQSLLHLKEMGKRTCLIDWTGIPGWYERHGFQVTNRYCSCSLALDLA